ncbi:MAG: 1-acyl-sn-glycerol-3-phosphate acyltransferase [Candidatus Aphodosoma sp.]
MVWQTYFTDLQVVMDNIDFDDIRPYTDAEMPGILASLVAEPEFRSLMASYFPQVDLNAVLAGAGSFGTVFNFQKTVILPVLEEVTHKLASSLTASGLENLTGRPAVFMSNHRDIVMDPTFLQLIMLRHDRETSEIAIGDNLLTKPWICDFVRMNKSFIVRRGLPAGETARAFVQLSSYIRHAVTVKHASVWIAQREGRAKDSDDRTQESLIKMFALSGRERDFISKIRPLNITPVAISYEYDPCDYLKALEFQHRRDNPGYKKTPAEDLVSMRTGIVGFKGRVHYTFTTPVNHSLDDIASASTHAKEQAAAVCALCDRQIHQAYVIYPVNRVAYTLLTGDKHFVLADPEPARRKAEEYLRSRLDLVREPAADRDFLWLKLLEMYANPLVNHLAAKK